MTAAAPRAAAGLIEGTGGVAGLAVTAGTPAPSPARDSRWRVTGQPGRHRLALAAVSEPEGDPS